MTLFPNLRFHLDLKVIQHILDKDKLVEKLIKQAITDNKNRSPQERVNVSTLATLLKEELDKLIEISHYSYETIKTRRSLIINQINKNGNIKIERVRKESDKRFYDYKIS